ncbi:hypothetical protein LEP1GSC016_3538 [Leptospira borgpetersenii serovar Hardjo-bovis str. Sponselee]|uniref:Uncharacterized protein n=2 Tax=Leptospira borgpetersenii TaxID=174 RepID=M6BZ29_LEPBO|nr:hypothetical protein LEP1GSC016_3538 [Leptospira borgpetersenii serovar Hardjo-bovis str. Sponselee]EMO60980.1 hypothetical protein LEP1GSC133_4044 [Leptospira borgpetersenii serovar Pomona str. 200901868]
MFRMSTEFLLLFSYEREFGSMKVLDRRFFESFRNGRIYAVQKRFKRPR